MQYIFIFLMGWSSFMQELLNFINFQPINSKFNIFKSWLGDPSDKPIGAIAAFQHFPHDRNLKIIWKQQITNLHNKQLVKRIIINKSMRKNIREQMNRYPVFSCSQVDAYIDESQLFKDEEIKKCPKFDAPLERKNQTIVSIYDRIITNNNNDPLYPQQAKNNSAHHSSLNSARNSRSQMKSHKNSQANNKSHQASTITKFVGELAKSLAKDDQKKLDLTSDINRRQKISLLKRIIEHYNIKSVQKKYYSNLIKTYGLRIESVNSSDIAVKKSIHPRISIKDQQIKKLNANNSSFKVNEGKESSFSTLNGDGKKSVGNKKFRPSNSFLLTKKQEIKNSRKQIYSCNKKRSTISVDKDGQQLNTSCGSQKMSNLQNKLRQSGDQNGKLIQKPFKLHSNCNTIQNKMKKYRQFLFLLNFSNHLYKQLEVDRYETAFKVYIGGGNNRNLIKSIIKKRFWFQQTNNPSQANLIWTQLKIQSFFQSQLCSIRREQEEMIEDDLVFTNPTQNPEKQQLTIMEISNKLSTQSRVNFYERKAMRMKNSDKIGQGIKYSKIIGKAKDYAPTQPILKILSKSDMKKYKIIGDSLSFKKNPSFLDKMKVSPHVLTFDQDYPYKMQNHLPANGLLGNKKAMYYNLREYCRLTGKNLSEYVPLTFHIKRGMLDEEFKAMSAIFAERRKSKKPNYWIMKPGEFSNRGQGITCTNKLEEIKKRLIKCRDVRKSTKGFQSNKPSSLIVQQYISNPLLYNSRKFDIRMFMMVTICNGKLKGYWYQEGYIRTSSFVWSLHEIQDRYIHLTNDAVQKNCEQYGLYEPGNKLNFNQFQRYLSTLPKNGRNLDFFKVIYPRMRSIAADLIRSTFINLDPQRLKDNFQLFGLDFMIDETFRPWLIQANTNPCLQLSCPLLERILPHMIQNAFRIAVDPIFPPPSSINQEYKYAIPQNAIHYNKFQLIFDEDEQGSLLRNLYKESNIMNEIDEFEEDQEQFEQQGEILDFVNNQY